MDDATTADNDDSDMCELITRILLEHFGDGRLVHADVVMDTVQYRLQRDETMLKTTGASGSGHRRPHTYHYGGGGGTDGRDSSGRYYCVWADDRASRAYRRCLTQLVQSGRIRVVYDCAGGCGGSREDADAKCDNDGCLADGRSSDRPAAE